MILKVKATHRPHAPENAIFFTVSGADWLFSSFSTIEEAEAAHRELGLAIAEARSVLELDRQEQVVQR